MYIWCTYQRVYQMGCFGKEKIKNKACYFMGYSPPISRNTKDKIQNYKWNTICLLVIDTIVSVINKTVTGAWSEQVSFDA